MMKEFNIVSRCCGAEVVEGVEREYPLGRGEYNGAGIAYKIEICDCCGDECEQVEACGICGEVGCLNECEVIA